MEQGKYILKEDELQKREEKLRQEKADMAQYRNNKEQKYAENYVKQTKKDQRCADFIFSGLHRNEVWASFSFIPSFPEDQYLKLYQRKFKG